MFYEIFHNHHQVLLTGYLHEEKWWTFSKSTCIESVDWIQQCVSHGYASACGQYHCCLDKLMGSVLSGNEHHPSKTTNDEDHPQSPAANSTQASSCGYVSSSISRMRTETTWTLRLLPRTRYFWTAFNSGGNTAKDKETKTSVRTKQYIDCSTYYL